MPILNGRMFSSKSRCHVSLSTRNGHSAEDGSHIIRVPIEEETLPGDRLASFHATKPDHILDGRFRTLAKLGYGTSSTVWLAKNLKL